MYWYVLVHTSGDWHDALSEFPHNTISRTLCKILCAFSKFHLAFSPLCIINLFFCFGRMAEVDWIPDFIRAWPQKASTLYRPCRSYPGKTSSCASLWHRNDSAPPEQLVSRRTCNRRPGAGNGCRMWFVNSWAMAWPSDIQWMERGVRPVSATLHHFDVPFRPNLFMRFMANIAIMYQESICLLVHKKIIVK